MLPWRIFWRKIRSQESYPMLLHNWESWLACHSCRPSRLISNHRSSSVWSQWQLLHSKLFFTCISVQVLHRYPISFTQGKKMVHSSSAKRRGVFLALFGLMFGIGILICYCLGAVLYWRYVASLPPLLYILLALGLFFPPESPIWLLGHKGENEARTALVWLRYHDCELDLHENVQ